MKIKTRIISVITALALLSGCASEGLSSADDGQNAPAGVISEENSSQPADTESSTDASTVPESTDNSGSDTPTDTQPAQTEPTAPSDNSEPQTPQTKPEETSKPAETTKPDDAPSGSTSGNTSGSTSGNKPSTNVGDNTLSPNGTGTEGKDSTGTFNYGEALQKALIFYELQRSGDIDEKTSRTNWRGDSGMNDGADVGLDLTGGLYDAGDNVKFNLPMAYTASMLAWSYYESKDAYKSSGQDKYILETIKWINDYLIKCHPESDVYYYQVGDGNADHSWWGAAEVMQMKRPAYKVTKSSPGSTVVGEAAAALASCALIYKDIDKSYSDKCLTHAKQLYSFAESTKSDSGYTAANGFYNSWSGFYDELMWAGEWLYLATGDSSYLTKAKQYEKQCGGNFKWTMCWDDKYNGAVCLLATITGEKQYKDKIEKNLDWWTTGTGGARITYSPKGLAWLDTWGSLRYSTTAAFLASVYADYSGCPSTKAETYRSFAVKQVDYALGSTGRSFVVGFGKNSPQHPHHRTSQGSWADNMSEPSQSRHILYGALVGGPDQSDGYTDTVSDYNKNEVACDYNAGFVGVLAKMYEKYGGKTIKNFGAIETVGEELYVEQKINASGNGFTEIKAMVYNKSAWPARVCDNLELRYFVDLSELYAAGGSASDVQVNMNYSDGAKFGGIYEWNKEKHIYYVSVDFTGVKIYPGGQSAYKKEVQFRMSANGWNPDNDPSFAELVGTNGSSLIRANHVGLYEDGKLVFGTTPDGKQAGIVTPSDKPNNPTGGTGSTGGNTPANPETPSKPQNPTAGNGKLNLSLSSQQSSGSGNTIGFSLDISNGTGASIDLKTLELDFFFTNDGNNKLAFWCDHAATNGSGYTAVTSAVVGSFSAASGKDTDTKCAITFTSGTLASGDTLSVQVRITREDWSEFNLGNDYSAGNAEHIVVISGGKTIFGKAPA